MFQQPSAHHFRYMCTLAAQKRCGQPATYLKQVLNDIALLNQRGPYAQMWELKKQYKQ